MVGAPLRAHDSRRWAQQPHLSVSLAYLRDILAYQEQAEIRLYRLSSNLAPYATHRHPEFWPEPETFDPNRFLGGRHEARHAFAWIPFGAGPRRCIGIDFAHVEGVLLLASLLQWFRLELPAGSRVHPETTITLRPRGGMPLRLVATEPG